MTTTREASRRLGAALTGLSSALCAAYPTVEPYEQWQLTELVGECGGVRHRRVMLARAGAILCRDVLGRFAAQDLAVRDAVAVLRAACLDAHECEQHALARRRLAGRDRHAAYTGLGMVRTRDGRYE